VTREETDDSDLRAGEKLLSVITGLEELGGAGVTELASHVGLAKSTTHYVLELLEENGFVVKDAQEYRNGLRFLRIGEQTRERESVYHAAQAELDELASDTGELVALAVEERGYGVYIDKAAGDAAIDLETRIGSRDHLHYTAVGKSILAHSSEEWVMDVIETRGLPARTDQTITDAGVLLDELESVRDRGVAINDEEMVSGFRAVGAPIFRDEEVVGAVSVGGPTTRIESDPDSELSKRVLRTTNVVGLNVIRTTGATDS
jgi:DNA-binding IclR family transcriptional regulator